MLLKIIIFIIIFLIYILLYCNLLIVSLLLLSNDKCYYHQSTQHSYEEIEEYAHFIQIWAIHWFHSVCY